MKRFLFALLIYQMAACVSTEQAARNYYTPENEAVPEDYCSNGETLLCLKTEDAEYNAAFKQIAEEVYKGKVRFVSEALLESLNTSTYRYLLHSEMSEQVQWVRDHRTGINERRIYYVYQFQLTDRKRRKDYRPDFRSGDYYALMRAYLLNLEELRIKNS